MPDMLDSEPVMRRNFISEALYGRSPLQLDIKQACRQIHNEITDMLYNNDVCFRTNLPKLRGFSATTSKTGLPFNRIEEIDRLNFSRFNSIRFEIDIPRNDYERVMVFREVDRIVSYVRSSFRSYAPGQCYGPGKHEMLFLFPNVSIIFVRYEQEQSATGNDQRKQRPPSVLEDFNKIIEITSAFYWLGPIDQLLLERPPDLQLLVFKGQEEEPMLVSELEVAKTMIREDICTKCACCWEICDLFVDKNDRPTTSKFVRHLRYGLCWACLLAFAGRWLLKRSLRWITFP